MQYEKISNDDLHDWAKVLKKAKRVDGFRVYASTMSVIHNDSEIVFISVYYITDANKYIYTNQNIRLSDGEILAYPPDFKLEADENDAIDIDCGDFGQGVITINIEDEIRTQIIRSLIKQFNDPMFINDTTLKIKQKTIDVLKNKNTAH